MIVVDHEPAAWYLLADGEAMFLDVSCEAYAAGYSLVVELTADERRAIVLEGRTATDRIALEIAASPEEFWDRQVIERAADVTDAISRYRDPS